MTTASEELDKKEKNIVNRINSVNSYRGIRLVLDGNTLYVTDGTVSLTGKSFNVPSANPSTNWADVDVRTFEYVSYLLEDGNDGDGGGKPVDGGLKVSQLAHLIRLVRRLLDVFEHTCSQHPYESDAHVKFEFKNAPREGMERLQRYALTLADRLV